MFLEPSQCQTHLVDHIASSHDEEIVPLGQNMVSPKRKRGSVVVEEWHVWPERAQITWPVVFCHGDGQGVGRIRIGRLQQVQERLARRGAYRGPGAEEGHIRYSHLAGSVSRQAHTSVRSYQLEVKPADAAHFQLIVAPHQKLTKG